MLINSTFQRTAGAGRVLAAAVLLVATIGVIGTAQAQQGGGGGGGGGGRSGGSMPNPVLKCLGPDCINVSQAQVACTANYCRKEEEEKKDSCDVRVCEIENGRRTCRIEVSYDERICIKNKFL